MNTKTATATKVAPAEPKAKAKVSMSKAQQKICNDLPTVSQRIRFLDSENFTRSQITKLITNASGGPLRYQHVRNVLVTPLATPAPTKS